MMPGRRKAQRKDSDAAASHALLTRTLNPNYINSNSVFTAPVAPDGARPNDIAPFLAIRSPAETSDRARRLVADAVRKVWINAPASWRRQFEEEAASVPRVSVLQVVCHRTPPTSHQKNTRKPTRTRQPPRPRTRQCQTPVHVVTCRHSVRVFVELFCALSEQPSTVEMLTASRLLLRRTAI